MAFRRFGTGDPADWSSKLADMMDQMLSRSFVQFRREGEWRPSTNVYESPRRYHICVDLAGVPRESIEVTCADEHEIVISGSRSQPRPAESAEYSVHAMEIEEGAFRRVVSLPERVDVNGIEARYDAGYLWISVPKIPC